MDQECPQMPAYVSVRTAYSEYDYRNSMLNTLLNRQAYANMSIYVIDTPDILWKYGTRMLAVRYIFMPTYDNVCPPYLTYE